MPITIDSSPPAQLAHTVGEPAPGPAARFIGLGDWGLADRTAWLNGWLRCEAEYLYRHWDTRLFSQADSSFEILVVHGEDAERLAQILREFRRVYSDKIMLAVMSRGLPSGRAQILRAGADGVFCISSDHRIAAAWLETALARRASARARFAETERASSSTLARRSGSDDFTPRERKILSLLESSAECTVDYRMIARAIDRPMSQHCVRAIQASVCKLNKKIVGKARIRNVPGAGYQLTMATLAADNDSRPAHAEIAALA
jgi:DNA-binding response OmpR family regulator